MKFNELKAQLQSGVNLSKLINIEYVPLISQKTMKNNIKGICLIKDNDFLRIDYTIRHLFELLDILSSYTDIEFEGLYTEDKNINSELAIEIYDYCKEHKIYDYVLENSDCKEFLSILNNEIEQEIEINNSVANVLNQVLNKLVDKIPSQEGLGNMMSEIPNVLSNLNVKPSSRKKKS